MHDERRSHSLGRGRPRVRRSSLPRGEDPDRIPAGWDRLVPGPCVQLQSGQQLVAVLPPVVGCRTIADTPVGVYERPDDPAC
jgi:hypothetical protein